MKHNPTKSFSLPNTACACYFYSVVVFQIFTEGDVGVFSIVVAEGQIKRLHVTNAGWQIMRATNVRLRAASYDGPFSRTTLPPCSS